MTATARTFSDSWHRVAGLRLALHPTVRVRRQFFRGENWYVIRDPFNNSFFRVRAEVYQFLARLTPERTVEQVWKECLESAPDSTPGQDDVIQMLTQLYRSNLLFYRTAPDSVQVFGRLEKRRREELTTYLMNILFARIPLLDPDALLDALAPIFRLVLNPLGVLCWLGVVVGGIKVVIDHADQISNAAEGALAPGNWPALLFCLVAVKAIHEMGHAIFCKHFGGEVHTVGVSLLVFTPVPFVDATSSWGFASRWHRALVGAGGMIFELFLAGLCAQVWGRTGAGLLHALAYNVMFLASVTTLLFDMNPLVRFDGYYILSDVLDIPNLASRADEQLIYVVETYLFGSTVSTGSARGFADGLMLSMYGFFSGAYKIFASAGIMLFVGEKFLILGLLMAVAGVVTWVIVPVMQFFNYLLRNPRLSRTRPRAILVVLLVAGGAGWGLVGLPVPHHFRVPGVLEAVHQSRVTTDVPGILVEMLAPPDVVVKAGTPLLRLENRDLDLDEAAARAQLAEIEALLQKARVGESVDIEPLQHRQVAIRDLLSHIEEQRASLVVRARQNGIWVAGNVREVLGSYQHRGTIVGLLVDGSEFQFTAVVPQDEISSLFQDQVKGSAIRIVGCEGRDLAVKSYQIIPFQQRQLPSAALGWRGGGEVAVSAADPTGLKATEPFFQIRALVAPTDGVTLYQGRSGQLRFTLTPETLLIQFSRRLRQLIQNRYHI